MYLTIDVSLYPCAYEFTYQLRLSLTSRRNCLWGSEFQLRARYDVHGKFETHTKMDYPVTVQHTTPQISTTSPCMTNSSLLWSRSEQIDAAVRPGHRPISTNIDKPKMYPPNWHEIARRTYVSVVVSLELGAFPETGKTPVHPSPGSGYLQ